MRLFHTALGLALLAAPTVAQSTWFADDLCTLADFSTAQAAIDAAADGDVIVVRNGAGQTPIQLGGKSLTLVGHEGFLGGKPVLGSGSGVQLGATSAGQTVTLRGLVIAPRLEVTDCVGTVWIEDCLVSPGNAPTSQASMIITDSDRVVVLRTDVLADDFEPFSLDAVQVHSGKLYAYGCTFQGNRPLSVPGKGKPGGDGLEVTTDGFALLDDCSLLGGRGGTSSTCLVAGDGGAGLRLTNVGSTAWQVESTFSGGAGGNNLGACPDGSPGDDVTGNGSANLFDAGGNSRGLAVTALAVAGDTVSFELDTQPGDQTLVALSLAVSPLLSSAFSGVLLPDLTSPLFFDFTGLSGSFAVGLAPDLAPVGMPLQLVLQPLVLSQGGDKRVGAGSWLTVLDPGEFDTLACSSTLWVDDDAPNDPGPNDHEVSDPLEDGTPEHPFDRISEALAVAFPGAEIVVRDGDYTPPGTPNPQISTSDITLRSENGPAACFLPGVFVSTTGVRARIEGFSIDGESYGVHLDGDDAVVADCVIANSSDGVQFDASASARIEGCTLTSNTTRAIHCLGAGGDLDVIDCQITDNGTHAVRVDTTQVTNLFIDRCTFTGNGDSAKQFGTIHVAKEAGAVIMRNTLMADNVNAKDAAVITVGPFQAYHCTFVNNGKPFPTLQFGGTGDLEAKLSHCIVWGPNVGVSAAPQLIVDSCLIENGTGGIFALQPVTYEGVLLSGPPSFVNTTTGNYHLGPTSPCIDAGDPAFELPPGEKDFEGNPRLMGAAVDIGADERVP